MKAVNLIPSDSKSAHGVSVPKLAVPTYALLGVLVGAIALVTLYVTASNSVADRQAQITSLKTQVAEAQSAAAHLASYGQFASLEQQRVLSVRGVAATRFDWNSALGELAAVIPANTSLQTLSGSVVAGVSSGGSGSGGLRSAEPGPAVEVQGCTSNQDDVARLISRLRTMDGVTRVALSSSAKASGTGSAAPVSSTTGPKTGCDPNEPTFDLIVFYQPISGAGAQGATSLGSSSATTTPTGGAK